MWTRRLPVPDSDTPVRSRMETDRLVARREVELREKTLYRMLNETAARIEELLDVNIEDLNLTGRRCLVKAKGAWHRVTLARPGPRGPGVGGGLLGRRDRAAAAAPAQGPRPGPVFSPRRRPGPGKVLEPRDMCPVTGCARLSYGRAHTLLDMHTAFGGPGTGGIRTRSGIRR
ncbi:site-specific integrase [Actinomadura harenae]|uniref:hypothetical protein n=1 Tax=Actinomadura harenae TaxID=2483351 RepID=UPI0018F6CE00|nr:hypothetical protein [Actinomadura harenae]